jgi:hypothetical protein
MARSIRAATEKLVKVNGNWTVHPNQNREQPLYRKCEELLGLFVQLDQDQVRDMI